MVRRLLGLVAIIVLGGWARADAITVYPIDRAEILAGSRFDLKVEFDRVRQASDVQVTVNGERYATVLGQAGTFVAKEAGAEASAFIVRDVSLTKPGVYVVAAGDGAATTTVRWRSMRRGRGRRAT
jgi:alkaline phosphatase